MMFSIYYLHGRSDVLKYPLDVLFKPRPNAQLNLCFIPLSRVAVKCHLEIICINEFEYIQT
jgi:hypothetical protein